MPEQDDNGLLRDYVDRDSQEAFAALVSRHINKVYSVALRHGASPTHAAEITQAVFVILARKAAGLRADTIVSSWLHQTARLTTITHLRGEIRRVRREREAHMQTVNDQSNPDDIWRQLAPELDRAITGLSAKDRAAIVLRFFDGRSMKEIGVTLSASEDAAKKRVDRAVEKLRRFFARRGVVVSAAALTAAISAHSIQAAPAVLATTTTALVVAPATTASASTLTLIKGALKLMAWTKLKTAVVIGAIAVLTAGTAAVVVIEKAQPEIVDSYFSLQDRDLVKAPPGLCVLRPTHFADSSNHGWSVAQQDPVNRMYNWWFVGRDVPIKTVISVANGARESRIIFTEASPSASFDFLITVTNAPEQALRDEIKKSLGLEARKETRETDVYLLRVKSTGARGVDLAPNVNTNQERSWTNSRDRRRHYAPTQMSARDGLAADIEVEMKERPVVDRTGLDGWYGFSVDWSWRTKPDLESVNRALDEIGLELVSGRDTVEMLLVEKVK